MAKALFTFALLLSISSVKVTFSEVNDKESLRNIIQCLNVKQVVFLVNETFPKIHERELFSSLKTPVQVLRRSEQLMEILVKTRNSVVS